MCFVKPVCSNREELDILIKAAKEQGVVFMEAMKNVHSPGFHAMMDNLHKIGTVRSNDSVLSVFFKI